MKQSSFPVRFLLIRHAILDLFVSILLCAGMVSAPGQIDQVIPTVGAGGGVAEVIAIPDFDLMPGGTQLPEVQTLTKLIYRNLEISGDFKRPVNPVFVAENHRKDNAAKKTNFEEWRRLDAVYLVVGTIKADGGMLEADVRIFQTRRGELLKGRKYTTFPAADLMKLGRRIADDIVFYITGNAGLASTQIAYVSGAGWGKDIWLMYSDGTEQHRLSSDNTTVVAPCWGMSGMEIYYTSYRDHNPDLCGVTIDGSKTWYISRQPGLNISPCWSEKKQRIVLTLGRDGNPETYTMSRNGDRDLKNMARLTHNRFIDGSPWWSPSGTQVCFTSDRSGSPQLYIMDADGMSERRLTNMGSGYNYNDGAAWSPKGDKIAFSCQSGGVFDICVTNLDGTDVTQLTHGQGHNEDPCWSPDGSHIVFSSNRTGETQVWVMRENGSNQTPLTMKGSNFSPAWGPFVK